VPSHLIRGSLGTYSWLRNVGRKLHEAAGSCSARIVIADGPGQVARAGHVRSHLHTSTPGLLTASNACVDQHLFKRALPDQSEKQLSDPQMRDRISEGTFNLTSTAPGAYNNNLVGKPSPSLPALIHKGTTKRPNVSGRSRNPPPPLTLFVHPETSRHKARINTERRKSAKTNPTS
jgi:hypothetical protein